MTATLRLQDTPFRKQTWRLRWETKVWRSQMEITSPVTSTCLGWSTLFEPHFITFLGNYAFSLQKKKYFIRFGLTCRLFILSGVVHCLRAQQTTTLHSVWSDHWQRVCVPSLQSKPVWSEWRCISKQELSCHCQNRYVHMYNQIYTGNICATVQSILGDVWCRVKPLMTFACYL